MEKIILFGVPVYTSDELKNKLKIMIGRYGLPQNKSLFLEMIDTNILIPIINEPSKLRQLIMRIKSVQPLLGIHGAAYKGKGYVIFSDQMNPKKIMFTILHEMIHVSMQLSPVEFGKINLSLYIKFYSHYYKFLFEAKTFDQKLFAKFIDKLLKDEREYIVRNNTYSNILRSAFKEYTGLPDFAFNKRVEYLIDITYQIARGGEWNHYDLVLSILRKTYRDLFKGMDYTAGIGQELYLPSEIIAILSTIEPEHSNVIKSLKLIKPGESAKTSPSMKKIVGF